MVKQELGVKQLHFETEPSESITVDISGSSHCNSTVLVLVYRSPNSTNANDEKLLTLINTVSNKKGNLIIVGDFNYPSICWKEWEDKRGHGAGGKFLNCMRRNLLLQHVTQPTRFREGQEPHVLDLVITNDDFVEGINYTSPLGRSDHVALEIECHVTCSAKPKTTKYNWNKGRYEEFRHYLKNRWNGMEDTIKETGVDDLWVKIKEDIDEGIKTFVPVLKPYWKAKWKHPINKEQKAAIKRKHRLWNRLKETGFTNKELETKYKNQSNQVKVISRTVEQVHQRNVARAAKNNPKKFWNFVRSKTTTQSTIGDLKTKNNEGELIKVVDDTAKATALSGYFSSVFTRERDLSEDTTTVTENVTRMEVLKVHASDIAKKLEKIRTDKSPGPDQIYPRVLYEIREEIAKPLEILFNKSLEEGSLPKDWISADIAVIYKKDPKWDVSNYRPVSLTCIVCKILESFVRDAIMEHFTKTNYLAIANMDLGKEGQPSYSY